MTDSVLVPVDGSPLSRRALRHALGTFPEASITALHVVDVFEPGYGDADREGVYEPLMGTEAWYDRAQEASERILAEAEELAADYDREVTTASEIGDPKRVIVAFTEEEGVDHLVVGTHGRTDEDRPLFGSVAETVARRSPVPVTLIR